MLLFAQLLVVIILIQEWNIDNTPQCILKWASVDLIKLFLFNISYATTVGASTYKMYCEKFYISSRTFQ